MTDFRPSWDHPEHAKTARNSGDEASCEIDPKHITEEKQRTGLSQSHRRPEVDSLQQLERASASKPNSRLVVILVSMYRLATSHILAVQRIAT